ncbi:PleD family two-component system response regulator [Streptomyces sp. NPDC005529]|uniref:response regulator n=1 Tax=unclassified Streptomyces TaxID=2593676 RepID=UPI0033AA0894
MNSPMTSSTSRILVVDDDRTSRLMLTYRLELAGLKTEMCENGRQALEKLREEDFDIVLLDVVMPDMDGYSTLEAIKNDPRLRDIPIVMMSALGEMDSVIRCLEMGAQDYMPKPLDSLLLTTRINALLLRAELREQSKDFHGVIDALTAAVDDAAAGNLRPEVIAPLLEREDVGQLARKIIKLAQGPTSDDSPGPAL